jgi:hypothetical protein
MTQNRPQNEHQTKNHTIKTAGKRAFAKLSHFSIRHQVKIHPFFEASNCESSDHI